MSGRELKRLGVLARVEKEALNLVNAAEILGLSYRQAKRIWRRYQEEGAEGLQHSQRRTGFGAAQAEEVSLESAAPSAPEILGRDRGTIWANAGSRTPGE
jgi:transposase